MRNLSFLLPLIALLLLVTAPVFAQDAPAQLRVASFSPDAGVVEVYIDGVPSGIQTLKFNEISGWVQIPPGSRDIAFVPAGNEIGNAIVGPFSVTLPSGSWSTIPLLGLVASGNIYSTVISENYPSAIPAGSTRITLFNGIPGGSAIDLLNNADGTLLAQGISFGRSTNIDLPAGTHNLRITASGSTSGGFSTGDVPFAESTYYLLGPIRSQSGGGLVLKAITQQAVSGLLASQAQAASPVPPTVPPLPTSTAPAVTAAPTSIPLTSIAPTNTPQGTLAAVLATQATQAATRPPATATRVPTVAATPTRDPSRAPSLFDLISEDPRLTITTRAIVSLELERSLRTRGPFTIFAPVDSAWERLLQENPNALPDEAAIRSVFLYHVIEDRVPTRFVFDAMTLLSVEGFTLRFNIVNEDIRLNNRANVLNADIEASNGLLHVIDAVLVPAPPAG